MTIHEDRDPRFKRLELKAGLFIIAALAGIVVAAVLVGAERDFFSARLLVSFTAPGAEGITEGMPVKLSGFRIGRVKRLDLTETASVKVTLLINGKYRSWVGAGSKARVAKEGLIGSSYVEVTPASRGAAPAEDGAEIEYEKRRGMDEAVMEVRPVMEELKTLLHYVNDPDGDVKKTMAGVREFSSGLTDLRQAVREAAVEAAGTMKEASAASRRLSTAGGAAIESAQKLVNDLDGIAVRLEPAVANMERASTRVAETAERLPAIAVKLDETVDNVRALTGVLRAEGPVVRSIIYDASEAARDSRKMARGLMSSWPMRLTLPEPRKPELVPLDGYLMRGGRDDGR